MKRIKIEPEGLYHWVHTEDLEEVDCIHSRVNRTFIRKMLDGLKEEIPELQGVNLVSVDYYNHDYQENGTPTLTNLLPFYRVQLNKPLDSEHTTRITVWLPVKWNARFIGLAGTGASTDCAWRQAIGTNILTWPLAVNNGFACASTDGGLGGPDNFEWGFCKDGSLNRAQIDSWCHRATHEMTVIGKLIVQGLYDEIPEKCYMHGTSGGGRQAMEEVQRYPKDYDGVWADSPAMDYNRLNFSALWAAIVMNNEGHTIPLVKFQTVYDWMLGRYSKNGEYIAGLKQSWIPKKEELCGLITPVGAVTEEDYRIMRKIWEGPVCADGSRMGYGFGPEIIQWPYDSHPYGYLQFNEAGDPILMAPAEQAMRWYTGDPDWDWKTCSYEDFEKIYHRAEQEFSEIAAYNPDLTAFVEKGGKLLITHGSGDPVIPWRICTEYYRQALQHFEDEEQMNESVCLFLQPGAGHSTLGWAGPTICNSVGMAALMDWVENGNAPRIILTVKYDIYTDTIRDQFASQRFNMWML